MGRAYSQGHAQAGCVRVPASTVGLELLKKEVKVQPGRKCRTEGPTGEDPDAAGEEAVGQVARGPCPGVQPRPQVTGRSSARGPGQSANEEHRVLKVFYRQISAISDFLFSSH